MSRDVRISGPAVGVTGGFSTSDSHLAAHSGCQASTLLNLVRDHFLGPEGAKKPTALPSMLRKLLAKLASDPRSWAVETCPNTWSPGTEADRASPSPFVG